MKYCSKTYYINEVWWFGDQNLRKNLGAKFGTVLYKLLQYYQKRIQHIAEENDQMEALAKLLSRVTTSNKCETSLGFLS